MKTRGRWRVAVRRRFQRRASRGGERWRRFEVERARALAAAGASAEEIGARLGRTAAAVRAKLGESGRW